MQAPVCGTCELVRLIKLQALVASLSLDLVPIENKAKEMTTCGRPRSGRVMMVRRKILPDEMAALEKC